MRDSEFDDVDDDEMDRLLIAAWWASWHAEILVVFGYAGLCHAAPICGWHPGVPTLEAGEAWDLHAMWKMQQLMMEADKRLVWEAQYVVR